MAYVRFTWLQSMIYASAIMLKWWNGYILYLIDLLQVTGYIKSTGTFLDTRHVLHQYITFHNIIKQYVTLCCWWFRQCCLSDIISNITEI